MPVDGTRVTTLYAYGLPGPPQTFSAKTVTVSGASSPRLGYDPLATSGSISVPPFGISGGMSF